ncbi:hypothetical protein X564_08570 [Pseudoalteromonas agarivorans]|nr:hypothetical protein X564_08570 [Pseudoalteromonas agarivorans]
MNPRQPESQSGALPTEQHPPLHTSFGVARIIHNIINVVKPKIKKKSKKINIS